MNPAEIKTKLESQFPGIQIQIVSDGLVLKPEDLVRTAQFLKEAGEFKMNYLSSITAVDYLEYCESVYHLYSVDKRTGPVVLRVRVLNDGRLSRCCCVRMIFSDSVAQLIERRLEW